MKKQVLILILALLAISFSASYGQAKKDSDPVPLDCAATFGPLSPIAGVPYLYSATIAPVGGSAYWYATLATTFMTAGARPLLIEQAVGGTYVQAATNYMVGTAGATSPTATTITWKSAGLSAAKVPATDLPKLFVVVEYDMAAVDCANNLKVIPIRPIDAFTVDIKSMTALQVPTTNYGDLVEQCFDRVRSAVLGPGGLNKNGIIDYDFGTNVMYYEVVAANFTGSFTPSFQITGLQPTQTARLAWSYTRGVGAVWTNLGAAPVTGAGPITVDGTSATVDASVLNTSLGVSIYVRVTIENDDFEGLALTPITLAVDAVNAEGTIDVINLTCLPPSPLAADYVDLVVQRLKPRPTVLPVAPVIFIDKK